jgi:hypothetical protein
VFAALERNDRAQHGEPQKKDRGELIRPHDRLVKDVARQNTGEQDDNLGNDQQRRRDLNERNQDGVDPGCPVARAGRASVQEANRRMIHGRFHVSSPLCSVVRMPSGSG